MLSDFYTAGTAIVHGIAQDLSGGDPMAKGLVIMSLLAGLGYVSRNVPKRIRNAFDRRCKVSIKFENPSWNEEKRLNYMAASKFVAANQVERKHLIEPNEVEDGVVEVTPDYDSGWFWYRGRPYTYELSKAAEQGAVPRAVRLSTWFSTPEAIMKLVDLPGYREAMKRNEVRRYYRYTDKDWNSVSQIEDNSPLFLPAETKALLDRAIANYRDNAEWFKVRGIPRKLLIILYGEPGTGKSRIGRYVADQLGYNFGTLTTGSDFLGGVRSASEESRRLVVSVPDFDDLGIGASRDAQASREMVSHRKTGTQPMHISEPDEDKDEAGAVIGKFLATVSLTEVLNLFEGDIPLNNSVVVMSTNCIEKVDSALLRSSRCDLLLCVGRLSYNEVNSFYKHYYETDDDLGTTYQGISVTAASIMGIFKENPHDKHAFRTELAKLL